MGMFEKDGYVFFDGFFKTPVFNFTSSNTEKQVEYLKKNNIKNISFEKSLLDFSFMDKIPFIEEVYISSNIKPVDLYKLKNLKRIIINISKKNPFIDYSQFINLEYLSIDWYNEFPDLSNNYNLKELVVWKYKPKSKSLNELTLPKNLRKLHITESNIENLEGLALSELIEFEGHYCSSLRSLKGLEEINKKLKSLVLDYCRKLENYNSLENCRNLEKIILGDCGDIPNLNWLKNMKKIKHLSFYNTKLLDGDVSLCFGIEYVSFKNSKNYNHKIEEFR